jgi:hypothetical protein
VATSIGFVLAIWAHEFKDPIHRVLNGYMKFCVYFERRSKCSFLSRGTWVDPEEPVVSAKDRSKKSHD